MKKIEKILNSVDSSFVYYIMDKNSVCDIILISVRTILNDVP